MRRESSFNRYLSKGWEVLRTPLLAVLFGMAIGALVILSFGQNPWQVYLTLFQKSFFEPYYLGQTLTRSTPVIICALAVAMSWRAGYINLGVEGQMITGTITAVAVALSMPGPAFLVGLLSWLAGMAAGALYALLPALIEWKTGASLIIVSLMLNYIAADLAAYLVTYPLRDQQGASLALQTPAISGSLQLPRFSERGTLNLGFLLALLLTLAMVFYIKKTVLGYHSKMTGFNPHFALYGGVEDKKVMMITMALSGAMAAIAGCSHAFGVTYRFVDGMLTSTSFAWTGLMAALIANLHPIGIFFSSIFLSGLSIGGATLQRSLHIPSEIATIIQCCITLFVSVKWVWNKKPRRKAGKKTGEEVEA